MMKAYICRNKHPAGRLWNMAFGLAQLADGIVRVLSFGFFHTRLPLEVSRLQARVLIKRIKQKVN